MLKKLSLCSWVLKAHIRRMPRITLKLNNEPLAKAFTYRYLGINVDTNLNFKSHTKGVI